MAISMAAGAVLQPTSRENLSRLSNVPFWGGCWKDEPEKTYETTSQRDFKLLASLPKRAAAPRPVLAQVEHRDLQHIKEFETEAVRAFSSYRPVPIIRVPAWTKFGSNLKMHSDKRCLDFHTTQSESFQHLTTPSTRRRAVRPVVAVQVGWPQDKLSDTTQKSSYVPHKVSPVIKAKVKHLGGPPAITGDRKYSLLNSSYNDDFQYRWCPPPKSTEKQFHSSLAVGDKGKIAETETTQTASFSHTGACSPVTVKERLCVNLGDDRDRKWTTTTSDTFTEMKPGRLQVQQMNRNLSSVPRGDTDKTRNQERMTATTNRFFFPEAHSFQFPVHVDGPSARTKSNVQLGQPSLGGTFYSTTTQENYPQKQPTPVQPQHCPPGRVLAHQETGPAVSTMQSDYTPPNGRRQDLRPEQLHQIKASHIRPPCSEHYFTTTHKEAFEPKLISKASLDYPHRQHISHMPF